MKRFGAKLEKISKYGLRSETRAHEGGIASNREEERYGEKVLKRCTNCPSSWGICRLSKSKLLIDSM